MRFPFPAEVTQGASTSKSLLLPCQLDALSPCHPSCSPRQQTGYFSLFIAAEQIPVNTFGQILLRCGVTLLPQLGHRYFCVVIFFLFALFLLSEHGGELHLTLFLLPISSNQGEVARWRSLPAPFFLWALRKISPLGSSVNRRDEWEEERCCSVEVWDV